MENEQKENNNTKTKGIQNKEKSTLYETFLLFIFFSSYF